MIVRFARKHGVSIIADEVYQENVYEKGARFVSFTRVMGEMGVADISLFTLHSVSKGFLGECGHRGGYLELRNIPEDVLGQFIKLQSISLCANVSGQFATYFMVAPPQDGDESYPTYVRERDAILAALKRKAEILGEGINRIAGMTVDIPRVRCMHSSGSSFRPTGPLMSPRSRPRSGSTMRPGAIRRIVWRSWRRRGSVSCRGPGSDRRPGTFHFRTTFLPPQDEIEHLVQRLKTFHEKYLHLLEEA